jgi:hypothetical protein
MRSLKRSHVLIAVFLVSSIFIVAQLWFANIIKQQQLFNSNEKISKLNENPKRGLLRDLRRPISNSQNRKASRVAQLVVPLDKHSQEPLNVLHLLPFYNVRYNLNKMNLTIVYVDEKFDSFLTTLNKQPVTAIDQLQHSTQLGHYEWPSSRMRGINKKKIADYEPDSLRQFKCLNSNVKSQIDKAIN